MRMFKEEAIELIFENDLSQKDVELFLIDVGEKDNYDHEEVINWINGMSIIDRLEKDYQLVI